MTKFSWLLLAVLVLPACTMIPKYQRPAAPVAPQYAGTASTATNTAADLAWRDFISDERLQEWVALSLHNNRDLRVASLNVAQSRAQYRITQAAAYPGIDGTGSFAREHAAGATTDTWNANIGTTSYEVDLWGRVRSLSREALEKYFATDAARMAAKISLVAEVSRQYFALRSAEEQIGLAEQTRQAVQENYTVNQARFEAGASDELDLRTAEGQVQTAKINVLTYQRQRDEAMNALVLLAGQPWPANLPVARPFMATNLLAAVAPGLPSELVQRRPDILEAEYTLRAANANIGAARAAFFPRITFTSSIGTTSDEFSKLFTSGTGVWGFSPQITLPIFTGGQNRADLDSAKISTRIEIANYEKAIQTAFREVADALTDTQAYGRELTERAALVKAQQQRLSLATARYEHGADTYLNVLSAQQDLYSAQQGQIQAQYNRLASQISLYQALGGGWK